MKTAIIIRDIFRILSVGSLIAMLVAYNGGNMTVAAYGFFAFAISITGAFLMYLYTASGGFDNIHFPGWMGGL